MKTLGLLGGMSWESTVEYYRIINDLVNRRLGKLHSAKILLYSFDFEEIAERQRNGRWDELGEILGEVAKKLEDAGADIILICTNTMHKVADAVRKKINVPLLDIAEVTADRIVEKGLSKVALLGTKFTMEEDFYRKKLEKRGIEVLIPKEDEREEINRIIFEELCKGIFREEAKRRLVEIGEKLVSAGAQGIILGCTELPLIVNQQDFSVPVFDTTRIHAEAAVDAIL